MSPVIDVCPLSDLPPGATRIVEWEDLEIGLFNCKGQIQVLPFHDARGAGRELR